MSVPRNILGESDDIREVWHVSIKRGVTVKDVISGLGTYDSKHGVIDQVKMSCFPPAYFGFSFGFHRTLRWIIFGSFGNSNRRTSRRSQ